MVVEVLSFTGIASMAALYYHTRIMGVFKSYHVLILLFFSTSLFGGIFFFNGGIDGPVSFMFIMMMIILIIISAEKIQAFIFCYVLFTLVGIYVYEFYHPKATVAYTSRTYRYLDVISSMMYCMTFTALTVIVFKRSYNRERKNVVDKNLVLANLNNDLVKKNEKIQVLLRELNHRVKNNLLVVSGLLSLQANRTTDEVTMAALMEGKDRLMSMALLHKKLYHEETFNQVSTSEYLNELISYLIDDKADDKRNIKLFKDIDEIMLQPHQAVPFGLIINEIITNIQKHAFEEDQSSHQIRIRCKRDKENLIVEVEDNGKGMDAEKLKNTNESFGLELIDLLITQLDGTWSITPIENEKGSRVQIRFPIN
jgi:two-component sensor histidine kinase